MIAALLARYREWRDIRAAVRQLDIRNGWIVERGRDPRIFNLHCGHCGRILTGRDFTGGGKAIDTIITHLTEAIPCDHQTEESL